MPWESVHVWWGDDRYVQRDHPYSNVKAFDDIMLGIGSTEEGTAGARIPGVPIQVDNVHPFRTGEAIGSGRGAAWCADEMAAELRGAPLDVTDGWPVLDLVLLGIGPDAHLLSVFADSPALDSPALALAIPAPTHIDPARGTRDAQSGRGDERPGHARGRHRCRQGRGHRPDLRPGA